jgi:uncharacterized protein UPF0547
MPDAGDQKICPDCAEPVRAAARVCRFCGYRFDVAEAKRLEEERRAAAPWWKRAAYAAKDAWDETERKEGPRVRTRTPASCCGCSCGSVLAILVTAAALGLAIRGTVGVVYATMFTISASVAATHAVNLIMRQRVVQRLLHVPSSTAP